MVSVQKSPFEKKISKYAIAWCVIYPENRLQTVYISSRFAKSLFEIAVSNGDFFLRAPKQETTRGEKKVCVGRFSRIKVSISCTRALEHPPKTQNEKKKLKNRNQLGLAKKFGSSQNYDKISYLFWSYWTLR